MENYDKLCVIVINLNDEGQNSEKEIIGFLSTLLSTTITVEEKKKNLHDKYHFNMTKELEEDEIDMCNIGTATLQKGKIEGAMETAVLLLQNGKLSLEEIATVTKLPLETIQKLAEEVAAAE